MRLLLLIIVLSGCTAKFHLRQADRHLRKAQWLGANTKTDTVFVNREVIVPEVRFDTVIQEVSFTDTVVVSKDNVITKVKVNTVEKTIFINTLCPSDTVKIEVPVTITKEIEAGWPWWWLVVVGVSGIGLGILIRSFKS